MYRRSTLTHAFFGLLVALTTGVACTDADSTAADDGSDGDDGGSEQDPLYFLLSRIRSPDGRTMFVSMLPRLDAGQVDVGQALELTGVSRARVFDDKLYTFDGESGVISRFAIGPAGELTPDTLADGQPARVSLASLGVTLFWSAIVFVDEHQAFYFDLAEDLVVEWDPTDMVILNSFEAGVVRDGFDVSSGELSQIDGFVIVPLSWQNQATATAVETNAIGVIDLDDPSALQIIEDDRCVGTSDTFVYDGHVYAMGDNFSGLATTLSDEPLPPPCLLRWSPGADAFDPDYYLDLSERTGYQLVASGITLGDGTFMTQAYTSPEDPSTLGLFELLDGDHWQRVVFSLDGDETTLIDDVPRGPLSGRGWVVDGAYTFPRTDESGGEATLYRYANGTAEPQLTVPGEIFFMSRAR